MVTEENTADVLIKVFSTVLYQKYIQALGLYDVILESVYIKVR